MRHVVVGIADDGRSMIEQVREIPNDRESRWAEVLFTTDRCPPDYLAPERDESWFDLMDAGVSVTPGGVTWVTSHLPPDSSMTGKWHCTDSIDFGIILFGQVTLQVQHGEIVLNAGDTYFMPAAIHAWTPGPEGCNTVATLLGLPPRSAAVE
jgi:hypothetical protein